MQNYGRGRGYEIVGVFKQQFMAARKWNQVPGAQWWGNPSDPRSSVISKFPETVAEPPRPRLLSRTRNLTRNYYDFAEEVQNEDELKIWLKGGSNRGALRVYEPGSTYSELIKCTANTSAEVVMTKCVATELYVNYAGHSLEPLTTDSKPLKIQEDFLRSLGYVDSSTIQLEGINENLSHMFKFVAGLHRLTIYTTHILAVYETITYLQVKKRTKLMTGYN